MKFPIGNSKSMNAEPPDISGGLNGNGDIGYAIKKSQANKAASALRAAGIKFDLFWDPDENVYSLMIRMKDDKKLDGVLKKARVSKLYL